MDDNTEEFEGGTAGKSSISADLIRGHINTIILRSLYEEDKYGYEIISEINAKSHGQYTLKQPTLYSALKRLENQGYIQAYWKSDEVSAGGRRKYFRLTQRGREITEHNQAEWEYSRTVIDNLISDRNFDFNQPAPNPVDFKILKQATSRVPVVHGENEQEQNHSEEPAGTPSVEARTYTVSEEEPVYIDDPSNSEEPAEEEPEVVYSSETEKPLSYSEQIYESGAAAEPVQTATVAPGNELQAGEEENENYSENNVQTAQQEVPDGYPGDAPFTPEEFEAERERYKSQLSQADEESRRQAHENYLKLISDDDDRRDSSYRSAQYEENVDANDLIYNTRPAEERDYKNLIDKLFDNTLKNTDPAPMPPPPQQQPQSYEQYAEYAQAPSEPETEPGQQIRYSGYAEVTRKAAADGIRISTAEEAFAAGTVRQTTYNKGATLFKCSLIVGVIMLLEFIITLVLRDSLEVGLAYPIVILALGLATVLVCGILYGAKYGRQMRKPTSLKYIVTACVITVLLMVVIIIFGVIIQTNWSSTPAVLANIVLPCIIALNIPIFTLSFYLFTKN